MARASTLGLLQHLRRLADTHADGAACDQDLLARFVAARDEDAFGLLVKRHGATVMGVCRGVLHHEQDAEDAFQATFLVLARKAASIRKRASVGSWLYGVAYRLARKAQAGAAKRHARARPTPTPPPTPLDDLTWRELRAILHDELGRLPDSYRAALLLCYWEGKSQEDAASLLGWPRSTLRDKLERARKLLRSRLSRRGFEFSAALPAALAAGTGREVSAALVAATAKAAGVFAGDGMPAGTASAQAILWAEAFRRAAVLGQLQVVTALVLVVGTLAVGAGALARHALAFREPEQTVAGAGPPAAPTRRHRALDRYGDPLPAGAVTRLGTLRFRHEGEAGSVVFAPNGKILAACGRDGLTILWDARTGKELQRIQGLASDMPLDRLIDFSPDSRLLAAVRETKQIGFWDTATGQLQGTVNLPEVVDDRLGGSDLHTLRFSPDGRWLAVGGSHNSYVLDVAARQPRRHFKDFVGGLVFAPDSQFLVMQVTRLQEGANDLVVRDVRTGDVLRRLAIPPSAGHVKGRTEEVTSAIAFSPDGQTMATAGNARILLWDLAAGKVRTRLGVTTGNVVNLAFTPDGRSLVAGGETDARVRIWDPATGTERRQLDARLGILRSLALSPDGKTVAAGTVHNTIRLWDLASGKELFTEYQGHDAQVNSVAYSPDGRLLASGGENGQVRIWDTATGQPLRQIRGTTPRQLAFAPDGRHLVLLSPGMAFSGKVIHIWDAATGTEVRRLPPGDADEVRAIALSPDGRTLVSASWGHPKPRQVICHLNVWEPATGRQVRRLTLEGFRPESLAFSPDGTTVAVAGCSDADTVRLWDLQRGEEALALRSGQLVTAIAFSPDGRLLVTNHLDHNVRLWEVATGKEILGFQGDNRPVNAVAFSPNGRIVAAGGEVHGRNGAAGSPAQIRLWDVATGREIRHLQGHDSTVTSLAFSPDGSRLASGLRNSTVLLWEVPAPADSPPSPGSKAREALWSDLAGGDARKAYVAVWTLTAAPEEAVALLKERLKPAPALDRQRLRQLVADLESERYPVRQEATNQLRRLRDEDAVRLFLRQALTDKPSLEARQRLQRLLAGANALGAGEVLRGVRAVAILEAVGTPAARRVLETLATGAPEARQTQEAKASLERLARRSLPRP